MARSRVTPKNPKSKKQNKIEPVDLAQVQLYPVRKRANRVSFKDAVGKLDFPGAANFLESLPSQLKATDLRKFIDLCVSARKKALPFHWMMGAHVIKTGLAPLVIDLLRREIITGVTFNGAGVIHDLELAFWGGTSEDVAAGLADGSFGMARETGEYFGAVLQLANAEGLGFGEAAGEFILRNKAPHADMSILAQARKLGAPATIHIGIGSDIVAQHPAFSGELAGRLSHHDFKVLCAIMQRADKGGVVANIGSAAILPEVFLKALTVARNLERKPQSKIVTANFDMLSHYRPFTNVVTRPTRDTGLGFEFIGHHEIMLPLLAWILIDRFSAARKK